MPTRFLTPKSSKTSIFRFERGTNSIFNPKIYPEPRCTLSRPQNLVIEDNNIIMPEDNQKSNHIQANANLKNTNLVIHSSPNDPNNNNNTLGLYHHNSTTKAKDNVMISPVNNLSQSQTINQNQQPHLGEFTNLSPHHHMHEHINNVNHNNILHNKTMYNHDNRTSPHNVTQNGPQNVQSLAQNQLAQKNDGDSEITPSVINTSIIANLPKFPEISNNGNLTYQPELNTHLSQHHWTAPNSPNYQTNNTLPALEKIKQNLKKFQKDQEMMQKSGNSGSKHVHHNHEHNLSNISDHFKVNVDTPLIQRSNHLHTVRNDFITNPSMSPIQTVQPLNMNHHHTMGKISSNFRGNLENQQSRSFHNLKSNAQNYIYQNTAKPFNTNNNIANYWQQQNREVRREHQVGNQISTVHQNHLPNHPDFSFRPESRSKSDESFNQFRFKRNYYQDQVDHQPDQNRVRHRNGPTSNRQNNFKSLNRPESQRKRQHVSSGPQENHIYENYRPMAYDDWHVNHGINHNESIVKRSSRSYNDLSSIGWVVVFFY